MDSIHFLEDRIQALSLDAYEIYSAERRILTVEAKDGAIDSQDEAVEKGLAIRLFRGGKCGFACTSEAPPAFLERAVSLAYNSLQVVHEGEILSLPHKAEAGGEAASAGVSASRDEKFQLAIDLEKRAKAFDRRITRIRDASFSEETTTVSIRNSQKLNRTHTAFRYELSLMVMAEEAGTQEMAWDSDQGAHFSDVKFDRLADQTAAKAIAQLGGKPVATQKSPAVLDAVVVASFLGILSTSFFGDQVQKNRSSLKGKLGQSIYGDGINVVDEGNLLGGFSSYPFDGEGVTTQKNELVKNGILRGFLYDLTSGVKEGTSSTGNGVRPNFREPPRVGVTNFSIRAGEGHVEDLLKEMGRGFWIRDVIGLHTADPVTGDFSIGASGQWIEGGKVQAPVRGVTISGNLHEVLKKTVRAGGDVRWYHAFGAPALLMSGIDIGGL